MVPWVLAIQPAISVMFWYMSSFSLFPWVCLCVLVYVHCLDLWSFPPSSLHTWWQSHTCSGSVFTGLFPWKQLVKHCAGSCLHSLQSYIHHTYIHVFTIFMSVSVSRIWKLQDVERWADSGVDSEKVTVWMEGSLVETASPSCLDLFELCFCCSL